MQIQNPIIRGFYPDPSVCEANGTYYLVCSSFQYFPGVPLFESKDLIHWKQIGHCLTRTSQVELENVDSSGGIFAPTIRYYKGRFYMTTTNASLQKNFYIWTDDIYSEWSEPVYVDQGGIDPSLYFEDDRCYFMSNGEDDQKIPGIVQCEIDIKSGQKLTSSRTIWQGSGGRYLESPHLYKINDSYYLMAAEGGTEYGHMITYARGTSIFGPFIPYEKNPVLTNRNLGGFQIQGVGHGDLIKAPDGSFWILHLGFRQTGQWTPFHHLGREVFISPVNFKQDGWFEAGKDGTTPEFLDIPYLVTPQVFPETESFETSSDLDWNYLRFPEINHYKITKNSVTLKGTSISLDRPKSPTFLGIRQKEFNSSISCDLEIDHGEAGITVYMDENHRYDLAIRKSDKGYEAFLRLCIGNIRSIEKTVLLQSNQIGFSIKSNSQEYIFEIQDKGSKIPMGIGLTRYLSSEVAGGFTGVLFGLYAYSEETFNTAVFQDFLCSYKTN